MDSEHVAPKRVYSRMCRSRSTGGRRSSKKQKGHWSREGRGDTGGEEGEGSENGNGSVVLVSSMSRCGMVSSAVPSTLFHLNGFPRRDASRSLQSAAMLLIV